MKVVYIAHPLSADTDEGMAANRANATRWVIWAALSRGVAPQCSWIVMSSALPETAENRVLGLACDVALVKRCHELWLVGGRISAGMRIEREAAEESGIPVFDLTHMGALPPS